MAWYGSQWAGFATDILERDKSGYQGCCMAAFKNAVIPPNPSTIPM